MHSALAGFYVRVLRRTLLDSGESLTILKGTGGTFQLEDAR